jgi:hypothetical protein
MWDKSGIYGNPLPKGAQKPDPGTAVSGKKGEKKEAPTM